MPKRTRVSKIEEVHLSRVDFLRHKKEGTPPKKVETRMLSDRAKGKPGTAKILSKPFDRPPMRKG